LEAGRLAVGGIQSGTDLGVADDEVAGADALGRDVLHQIGEDERGGGQLLIVELGDAKGADQGSDAVAVDILDSQIDFVHSGLERDGLPVDLRGEPGLFQQFVGLVDADGVLKG
jgi:hypothetical protein